MKGTQATCWIWLSCSTLAMEGLTLWHLSTVHRPALSMGQMHGTQEDTAKTQQFWTRKKKATQVQQLWGTHTQTHTRTHTCAHTHTHTDRTTACSTPQAMQPSLAIYQVLNTTQQTALILTLTSTGQTLNRPAAKRDRSTWTSSPATLQRQTEMSHISPPATQDIKAAFSTATPQFHPI